MMDQSLLYNKEITLENISITRYPLYTPSILELPSNIKLTITKKKDSIYVSISI